MKKKKAPKLKDRDLVREMPKQKGMILSKAPLIKGIVNTKSRP